MAGQFPGAAFNWENYNYSLFRWNWTYFMLCEGKDKKIWYDRISNIKNHLKGR